MQRVTGGHGLDAADRDFFQRLQRELEHEIATYVYEPSESVDGTPLTADYVRTLLQSMRLCLVEPAWEEVNICDTTQESLAGAGFKRMCVRMAEDEGYVLVFDPVEMEYHLAWRGTSGLGTWGIRGKGVECFVAR